MPDSYAVLLVDAGRKKIPVIKVIRGELGLGLKEAKAVVDAAGGVVAADEIQKLVKLREAGALSEDEFEAAKRRV